MGLTFLDWAIVVVSMAFLIVVVGMSKRYMRSVAETSYRRAAPQAGT